MLLVGLPKFFASDDSFEQGNSCVAIAVERQDDGSLPMSVRACQQQEDSKQKSYGNAARIAEKYFCRLPVEQQKARHRGAEDKGGKRDRHVEVDIGCCKTYSDQSCRDGKNLCAAHAIAAIEEVYEVRVSDDKQQGEELVERVRHVSEQNFPRNESDDKRCCDHLQRQSIDDRLGLQVVGERAKAQDEEDGKQNQRKGGAIGVGESIQRQEQAEQFRAQQRADRHCHDDNSCPMKNASVVIGTRVANSVAAVAFQPRHGEQDTAVGCRSNKDERAY